MSYQYCGAIHIHSTFSDGTSGVEKIALAAKKAGLSWIIITDHNNLDAQEGIYHGVCVIKGEEISPRTNNHYLAFNVDKTIEPTIAPEKFVDAVHEQGGFGFIAHPDESKNRKNKYSPIYWENKNVVPDGIEIWNWFSTWADNYCDKNIFSIAYSFLFKHRLVKQANLKSLQWWDELNNRFEKIVPAIAGVDAHALKIKKYILPVTVFPYETMFKTLVNVLFLNEPLKDDFEQQKQQILAAIRLGNNMIVNKNKCKCFPVVQIVPESAIAFSGGSIKLDEETYIKVEYSSKALIRILRNGSEVFKATDKKIMFPVKEKGKYRVELLVNGYAIAYTNPIIVG